VEDPDRDEPIARYPYRVPADDHTEKFFRDFEQLVLAKLKEANLGELVLGITSVALVIVGIAQVVVAWENYNATTPLVGYARDNTDAAKRFADSADKINDGIGKAVINLNSQAQALVDQSGQTGRLADETKEANDNVVSADRPWLGATVLVSNFSVNNKPSLTFLFTNSGRRPAHVSLTAFKYGIEVAFPAEPDKQYLHDTTPSTNLIVPGQQMTAASTSDSPITQQFMDLINSGRVVYFAFAKTEYTDVRTKIPYWTHICIRYSPKLKTDTDNGFRNCTEYNDAQ
jgi:hypothetical protein